MSDAEAGTPPSDQVDDHADDHADDVRDHDESPDVAADEPGVDHGDDGPIGVEAEPEPMAAEPERSEADRLADDLETDLVGVDDALKRLDDGTYGTCTTCGAALDDTTLEENPTVSVCQPACAQPPEGQPTAG